MKLFFDFDGTLVDVAPRHYKVYSEIVELLGGEPLDQPTYWKHKREMMQWSNLLILSQLPLTIKEIFLEQFIQKIEDPVYLDSDRLFPCAEHALKMLNENIDGLYLVSLRRQPERLIEQVEKLGILTYFNDILSGHSEKDGSDIKSRLIMPALAKNKGAIIGDTEADILTGKALNMTTIAVTSGMRNKQYLRSLHPDHIVPGIQSLEKLSLE